MGGFTQYARSIKGGEVTKTEYDVKYKCPRCFCETWNLFGEDHDLMPICTKCGAFTWGEDK